MSSQTSATTLGDGRPAHRIHNTSDPLPGARGDAPTADYTPAAIEGRNEPEPALEPDARPEPNVSIGREETLPVGKANAFDKIYGKTEKVLGKVFKNSDMHETGELREAGGRKAAIGEARAPHD
ncbi:hypothetical protein FA95DRAFT_1601771 [Auriscalpium vulgare]|uniref:Uncharacterized protein n=1 Tax=Auriscalpium vulgare TaxID=40419 RepID=A0ACB8S8X6_9AGAM|nr:hypothetical protein FA95DRAFT_1601771 [Auriscalpium vulgare]